MSRKRPTGYVGATKAVRLLDLERLPSSFVIQPKIDGVYVTLYLDGRGRVCRVFMRSGAEAPRHLVSHLLGALVGSPHAEVVGELEAMTDAGEAAAARGPRRVHLFDCTHDGERSMVRLPYRERRDALWRMQSAVQCATPDDDHRPAPYRRYRDPVLPGWRLTPIVEQVPANRASWAWDAWVKESDGEGLVAVNLDAPVGRPASKLKCKPWESIDCRAVAVARTTVTCSWNGHLFNVSRGRHHVEVGDLVEVHIAGWYGTGVVPKFPAIVRIRRDLQ